MKEKLIVIPNNVAEIDSLRDVGISTFLLPLKDYSIGYKHFSIDEINLLQDDVYLFINRILTTLEIEALMLEIKLLKNIKGIFYEDLGVFYALRYEGLELINFQAHFNTHYKTINYLLELGNSSAVVANGITYNEIEHIVNNSSAPVVLFLFGKTEVMYSRRSLLNNYKKFYALKRVSKTITESVSNIKFDIEEDEHGSYLFDYYFYNGVDLLNIDQNNVKYYIINNKDLNEAEINDLYNLLLNNKLSLISELNNRINNGFLYKETIYRVKGGEK